MMKRGLLVLALAASAGACGDNGDATLNQSDDSRVRPGTVYISTNDVFLTEGGTAEFDITLSEPPAGGNVTVTISSANEARITTTGSLTFSEAGKAQKVTVTSVNDQVVGGDGFTKLTISAEGASNYGTGVVDVVRANVTDDEIAAGVVEPATLDLEEGQSGTFTLALEGPPTGDVTVTLVPSDTMDLAVSPATFTFTNANYNTPQTGTIDVLEDGEEENAEFQYVSLVADGGGYDRSTMPKVGVNIGGTGGTSPGVTVMPQAIMTSEDGTTANFGVGLAMVPPEGVTITATSGSPAEGTVSSPVTLMPGTTVAMFTVTGVDDTNVDGPQTYQVTLTSSSPNADFDGLSIPSVAVTNNDNDGATISVTPTMVTLNENPPESASISVALTSDPGETVTITQMAPQGRVMVQPTALVFTSANWMTPQTFNLMSIDNAQVTGDQQVMLDMSVSATQTYANYPIQDVTITLVDDDD